MLKSLKKMLEIVRSWFVSNNGDKLAVGPLNYFSSTTVLQVEQQFSKPLVEGVVVLIKNGQQPKWVRFKCPCRCGQDVTLSLSKNHHPHWSVREEDDGTISLAPSVWLDKSSSCGSHFFVKNNQVQWV
jgi:hypothetical protein